MRCRCPLMLTTVVAASAVLVAGCGGGSSPGVANVSSSTSTSSSGSGGQPAQAQIQQAAIRFAQCMRSNGVPSFPDPQPGGSLKFTIHQLGASPQVKAAMSACGHLLPAGGSSSENTAQTLTQTVAASRASPTRPAAAS
jgi:hypothetical protein